MFQKMKQQACEATGVEFIILDSIKRHRRILVWYGYHIYDSDGSPHTVEHAGVANHPGDAGMMWISDRIIEVVKD